MGDRPYDNAIRETRLYLCRGAHRRARTRLGSTSAELSLPRGLERGNPPKSKTSFFSFFKKNSTPNSLAYSDKSIVKNLRAESLSQGQKVGRATRRPTPLGYGNSLTAFCPKGSLGSEEVFCKRYVQRRDRGQRLGNTIKND